MNGAIRISGLPYTANSNKPSLEYSMQFENITIAVGFDILTGVLAKNTSEIRLLAIRTAAGATVVGNGDITDSSLILMSGLYFI
jgi:hypothetical protein